MLWKLRKRKHSIQSSSSQQKPQTCENKMIDTKLDVNITHLKLAFGKSVDIKFRNMHTFIQSSIRVCICYLDGIVKEEYINTYLIKPLMEPNFSNMTIQNTDEEISEILKNYILASVNVEEIKTFNEVIESICTGETVIFINGLNFALTIGTQGFESRSVESPETELSVRGSREGFNEVLKVNTSLIRRRIINPNLIIEEMKIGKQTNTNIRICYLKGIANPKIVDEVITRLKQIDTDCILESGYIEQYIEDSHLSLFPTVGNSEKPDKIAAKILEGRVAIFCDGTPFVLTVPYLFIESFQVGEDYYSRFISTSFIRILRFLALFLTVLTPALYVSLTTYHQEMIPTSLLTSMAASQEKVPFPSFVEALIMAVVFELIREAGLRMPRPVGSAISIVGAIVIGEAAVQAGFVSAPMVIVIALTGITSFVVTPLNDAIILSRFLLLLLGGSMGLYGVFMGGIAIYAHLCSLRSFGTPYLTPFAPIVLNELKDSFLRFPLGSMAKRPQSITWKKSLRRNSQNKPKSNKGEDQS